MINMAQSLPLEIIEEIFLYLRPCDRLVASLTCMLWQEASLMQHFWKDIQVTIESSVSEASQVLNQTRKPVQHITFKEVTLTHHDVEFFRFWDHIGPNLVSLQLKHSFVTETNLLKMLLVCQSLESLHLHDCRDMLITGKLFSNDLVLNHVRKVMPFLNELCLADNCSYLSDALVARFVSLTPQLKSLSFPGTSVSFHGGIYKRFYPDEANQQKIFSELVLTFDNILSHITSHLITIQYIDFSRTTINDKACLAISQVPGLRLRSLILQGCSEISHVGIGALCKTQIALIKLDLSHCSRITDVALSHISIGLPNLVSLSLQSCRAVTDMGISHLNQLVNLQHFNGQGLERITSVGLESGFLSKSNGKLKKINLSATQIDGEIVSLLCRRAPNITHLDLTSCVKAVNDTTLQEIWSCLSQLRELRFDWCVLISDEGFKLPPMNHFSESEICISDCLKGLNDLSLNGCSKITGSSLRSFLGFQELRSLNLNACSLITDEDIVMLCRNNPGLQVLMLNYCTNLSDGGVAKLIQLLPKLKRLELQGCSRLTNDTLTAIGERPMQYQPLTFLNLNHCKLMSLEYAEHLQMQLPFLRELSTSGLQ